VNKRKKSEPQPSQTIEDDSGCSGNELDIAISSAISDIDHTITPTSSSSSSSHKRKRKPTGAMLVADALKDLAESAKQVQKDTERPSLKLSKLEEALMLVQEDDMMNDEDMIAASDIFMDERKATIFCSFKKDLRTLWLKKQLGQSG
jgi:hypothetical protein